MKVYMSSEQGLVLARHSVEKTRFRQAAPTAAAGSNG